MYIEDKSSGTGLIQDIQKSYQMPVLPVPRSVDKYTRVADVLPFIQQGKVFIPKNAPWINDFLLECRLFTRLMNHKHDDQIDCLSDGIHFTQRDRVQKVSLRQPNYY